MKLYHIFHSLEDNYRSLNEAITACSKPIIPYIPHTAGIAEDKITPRVCLCHSIEDCLSAIKLLGVFVRCLAGNEDSKSYETHSKEVYPIIVCTFDILDEQIYLPSENEVPDVNLTREVWCKQICTPVKVEVKWLHMRSILWERTNDSILHYICKEVDFCRDLEGKHHPWIDGKGSYLSSREEEPVYEEDINRFTTVY